MKCHQCPHYKCGHLWNRCDITDSENFMPRQDCNVVNEDGEINLELYGEIF